MMLLPSRARTLRAMVSGWFALSTPLLSSLLASSVSYEPHHIRSHHSYISTSFTAIHLLMCPSFLVRLLCCFSSLALFAMSTPALVCASALRDGWLLGTQSFAAFVAALAVGIDNLHTVDLQHFIVDIPCLRVPLVHSHCRPSRLLSLAQLQDSSPPQRKGHR